ncbi:hypothetical protein [Chamaesiphon polymorphus]|uniref:Uncharacterized protein n=1 Tax=Chamaesiphon polymorphus CCALA 037 TaxID=2107692 RepID=A0A2T1F879_9CYAN|nr:hypothetical protein [Chamaesiphon polymorphus]PSB41201.1 hypothetical protein C7B77_27620 [Chamaesiphon polymorphus CCALA 037]
MPAKLPHNCQACAKLSAPQAREKNCWDDNRCPDRRSYHRTKAATAIRRKERRQNAAIGQGLGSATEQTDSIVPKVYAAELCLWINLSNNTIHAIGARLYCGSVMKDRIEARHCLGMTKAQLQESGRNILLALSTKHGISLVTFRVTREFDASLCPLTDCHVY